MAICHACSAPGPPKSAEGRLTVTIDTVDTEPYWWQDAPRPASDGARHPPKDVDVVVVGSGYTGLSAALTLARAGRSVLVLDRAQIGAGASTRNAGMMSGNLKPTLSALSRRFGSSTALAMYAEAATAREYLHHLIDAEGIDCDRTECGRLTPATSRRHYDTLAREAEALATKLGLETYAVSKTLQHQEIDSDHYHGVIVNQAVWSFQPARYHQGLLECVISAGVTVIDQTEVTGVDSSGEQVLVETAKQQIRCRQVMIATNGYTTPGLRWWQHRVVPIQGRMLATREVSGNLIRQLLPKGRVVVESNRLFHYFRPSPDGRRLLVGGRYTGRLARGQGESAIRNHLARVFPALGEVALEFDWHGYTAFTRDLLPHLGSADRVHYAMGFCGSGTVWGTWLGHQCALKILGSTDANTLFDRSLPGIPFYRGKPWFLPPAMGWFRFRDALDRWSD
ncbi:MAG: hypothetical protein CMO26_20965 [Thiotrichales bacterium]|nr:hypothetical protein [Thiotrichales bacterium]